MIIKIPPGHNLYPKWVCNDCCVKAGAKTRAIGGISTWHQDECGICQEQKLVTETRDFGHPTFSVTV